MAHILKPGSISRSIAPAIAAAALTAAIGCSTRLQVDFDENEDFSRYATWSWQAQSTLPVYAPHADAEDLHRRTVRLISDGLDAHGFERRRTGGDLTVSYHLLVQRRAVLVDVPRATDVLSSYGSDGSFWIEGTDSERRVVDDVRLSIHVSDVDGRVVWRAALDREVEDERPLGLDRAVASLLDGFPAR